MNKVSVPVNTYGKGKGTAEKIAAYAELDKTGEVFYKIEAQDANNKIAAIAILYDIDQASKETLHQITNLFYLQTEALKKG